MKLTLHWWLAPIALVVAGILVGGRFKKQGEYDFVTPLIGLMIAAGGVIAAIAFCLGRWLR